MTNKTELLPCPFCGELPVISKHFREEMYSFMHRCPVVGTISRDFRERAQDHADMWNTRSAPSVDVRAVVDGPLTDEGTMVQVLEPQQQKLLPHHALLPHPPRHWGFLQPEREVPGYTIEQMKEYGALCAAEALRQNK